MASEILINTDSGDGAWPDCTKPLPEPILTSWRDPLILQMVFWLYTFEITAIYPRESMTWNMLYIHPWIIHYSLPKLFSRCTTNKGLVAHNNKAGICCHICCRIFGCNYFHQHLRHVRIQLAGVRIELTEVRISQACAEFCFFAAWTPLQTARCVPGIITGSPGKSTVEGMAEIVENPAENGIVVDGHYSSDNCHTPTKA